MYFETKQIDTLFLLRFLLTRLRSIPGSCLKNYCGIYLMMVFLLLLFLLGTPHRIASVRKSRSFSPFSYLFVSV